MLAHAKVQRSFLSLKSARAALARSIQYLQENIFFIKMKRDVLNWQEKRHKKQQKKLADIIKIKNARTHQSAITL